MGQDGQGGKRKYEKERTKDRRRINNDEGTKKVKAYKKTREKLKLPWNYGRCGDEGTLEKMAVEKKKERDKDRIRERKKK